MNQNINGGDELQKAIDEIAATPDFGMGANMESDAMDEELEKVFNSLDINLGEEKKNDGALAGVANDAISGGASNAMNNTANNVGGFGETGGFGGVSGFGVEAKGFEEKGGDFQMGTEKMGEETNSKKRFEEVRKEMLLELFPLMDKISVGDEQKFKIYQEMYEATGNKEMIAKAYENVKKFNDEQKKAEALMYLIEKLK